MGIENRYVFISNQGDIDSLRRAVRKYKSALKGEREHADRLEAQRNSQILEATVFANLARSFASELGFSRDEFLKLWDKCKVICESDLDKRGLKNFAEYPPKFTIPVK